MNTAPQTQALPQIPQAVLIDDMLDARTMARDTRGLAIQRGSKTWQVVAIPSKASGQKVRGLGANSCGK